MTASLPQIVREVGTLHLDRIARTSGETGTEAMQVQSAAAQISSLPKEFAKNAQLTSA